MSKNKITIALILIATIAVTLISFMPIAKAQQVQYYPQFTFIGVAPDPVGVNQPVTLVVWTGEIPPTTPTDDQLGSVGNRQAWTGQTITVTSPGGDVDTIALPASDPVGGGKMLLCRSA